MRQWRAITVFLLGNVTVASGADLLVPNQYPTIQSAVQAASDGDTILLSPGTYQSDTPGVPIMYCSNKSITVRSASSLSRAVLDCMSEEEGISLNASPGNTPTVTLSGLNIVRSKGNGLTVYRSDLSIQDCTISECEGAAIFAVESSIHLNSTSILENVGASYAAVTLSNSTGSMVSCRVEGNVSEGDGGGLRAVESEVTIVDSAFNDNVASKRGGAVAARNSTLHMSGCAVRGNAAGLPSNPMAGGGMYLRGSECTMQECWVSDNTAFNGGGISAVYSSSLDMALTHIVGNHASNLGGGVHVFNETTLTGNLCAFSGNTADFSGGGLHAYVADVSLGWVNVSGNHAGESGGGLTLQNTSSRINFSEFTANTSSLIGGAAYVTSGSMLASFNECAFTENVAGPHEQIWRCSGGAIYGGWHSVVEIASCQVHSNHAYANAGGVACARSVMHISDSNISGNIADQEGAGVWIGTHESALTINGCRIANNSAGEGHGGLSALPSGDLDTEATLIDSTFCGNAPENAVGAWFEEGLVEFSDHCCRGDVDADATVNWTDLELVLNRWGPCGSCVEDLDGSGRVGIEGVLAVLEAYGQVCEVEVG